MDIDFWHQRWAERRLGFHQVKVNSRLKKFWRAFAAEAEPGATVLAPLCGKSLDLLWLARAGHHVIGVEVSAVACRDFFAENGLRYAIETGARGMRRYVGGGGDGDDGGDDTHPRHPRVPLSGGGDTHPRHPRVPLSGGGDTHPRHPRVLLSEGVDTHPRHPRVLLSGGDDTHPRHPRVPLSGGDGGDGDGDSDGGGDGDAGVDIELWCGDWFDLRPGDLERARLVYDRAALIALPQAMRGDYAAHLAALLQPRAQVFLISMDYDERKMKGPPFSVPEAEVRRLFAADFAIDIITQSSGPDIVGNLADRGLDSLNEKVYRLRRL